MEMFVVLYKKPEDPTESEQQAMLKALENIDIIDMMPGSILVQADEQEVRDVVQSFENWHVTPSQTLSI